MLIIKPLIRWLNRFHDFFIVTIFYFIYYFIYFLGAIIEFIFDFYDKSKEHIINGKFPPRIRAALDHVLYKSEFIHNRYRQYIYTGFFLFLNLRFILYLFSIKLPATTYFMVLLFCLIIASTFDIYHYIYEGLGRIFRYCFYDVVGKCNWDILEMTDVSIMPVFDEREPYHFNNYLDRFFFSFYLFYPFFILRYYVMKEPMLFMVIHIFVIVKYFQENDYIFLSFIYLFILAISRFLFFLSNEHFRSSKYKYLWVYHTDYLYKFRNIKKNIQPVNLFKIFALTFSNLKIMILMSGMNFLQLDSDPKFNTVEARNESRYICSFIWWDSDINRWLYDQTSEHFINLERYLRCLPEYQSRTLWRTAHYTVDQNEYVWIAILILLQYIDSYIYMLIYIIFF